MTKYFIATFYFLLVTSKHEITDYLYELIYQLLQRPAF